MLIIWQIGTKRWFWTDGAVERRKPAFRPGQRWGHPVASNPGASAAAGMISCRLRLMMVMLMTVAGLTAGIVGRAQTVTFGAPKKISIPVYFSGTSQKRSVLTGALAIPQANGEVLIKALRIDNFDRAGNTNIIVEAPECHFNYTTQNAWSDGPLRVSDGRGRFVLEGKAGFLWRQTNSSLFVSNQVQAVIRKDLIQLQPNKP